MAKKIPKIVKQIRNHENEKVDYSYQKNISYSQISMYKNCPKKWSLLYKDKIKVFTSNIHSIFGTAMHETLQHYLTVMYEKSGAAADRENLIELYEENLRNEYQKYYKKNNNQHFSTAAELREFYEDGVKIIKFFTKKRNSYFTKRGWHLVGCEVPINIAPYSAYRNVIFTGYLDVVMYHEPTDTFKIIDIKTSTKGWNKYVKKDEDKQFQLILYKKYFSEKFNIPLDKIKIEFFILKRKIYEDTEFPIPRIQTFTPASGKVKMNKATKQLEDFLNSAFNKKGYQEKEYKPKPSEWTCKFCPFAGTEHCKEGII